MQLLVDLERVRMVGMDDIETGILVPAVNPETKRTESIDCIYLDRDSMIEWLTTKQPVFSLNLLLALLGHKMMTQEEIDAHVRL